MSTELVPAPKRPEDFPPEVHASLAELRAIAKQATSHTDPSLRRATDDEIALAQLQRKPGHCVASSRRTGLPCTLHAIKGGTVCIKHGGKSGHVRRKAERRLAALALPTLAKLHDYAMDGDRQVRQAAVKAATDLLDRAEIGTPIQAKVAKDRAAAEQATQQPGSSGVTVNIGFLQAGTDPDTITVKALTVKDR